MKRDRLSLSGGALVEGVMIKKDEKYAMALRKGNSDIEIIHDVYKGILGRGSFRKMPILRGIFALIDYLTLTIKAFLFSSDFYEDNSREEPGTIQKFLKKFTGKYHEGFEMIACITVALIISIGGFIVLPHIICGFLADLCIPSSEKMIVVETVLRVALIAVYGVFFFLKKDFRKICRYHGAQHKVINCIKKGNELTIRNAKKASRYDKSCDMGFLLLVFLVSVVLFAFVRSDDIWIRIALRVLIVPIVASIIYEIMLVVNNSDGIISKIFQTPSKFIQKLIVTEPTDDMLEVAIESLQAVFDWRDYLGLPPAMEDESYSEYDYVDNVSASGGMYNDTSMMQENIYDNNYYSEGSYNESYGGAPYNYNMADVNNTPEYDNLGYEDYNNGQYFVESKDLHNPQYTDINDMVTRQPLDDAITKQPGIEDDYSMYDSYMQNSNYQGYNNGYDQYGAMQYNNMQQEDMYNQGNYPNNMNNYNGNYQDDDLKMLDRYFTDDNY